MIDLISFIKKLLYGFYNIFDVLKPYFLINITQFHSIISSDLSELLIGPILAFDHPSALVESPLQVPPVKANYNN